MCIAIYKDVNKIIPLEYLEQSFKSNPDGAGFMYVENKKLHLKKGFFSFADFWKEYEPHQEKQAVLHFRIKTHGAVNETNCHPFHINKSMGFVHNGIISGFGKADFSDTYEFNEEVLKPLVNKWGNLAMFEPAIKHLVEQRIGYSKLIFLDKNGNADIFNEDKGVWDTGVWYSNSSYKPVIKPVSTLPSTSKYSGYRSTKPTDVIKVEDLVVLSRGYYDNGTKTYFKKGELFEVVSVNSNYTVDLMSEDKEITDFIYNVPFSLLDFYDDDAYAKDIYDINDSPYYNKKTSKDLFWNYADYYGE